MKKIILFITLVCVTALSNAQNSTLSIVKINNMTPAEFKASHPDLIKGESLVLTVKYANILPEGKKTEIRARVLNDYNVIPGIQVVSKAVTTDANPQTVEITIVVPSTEVKVARIQVLALGNKADGSQGNIFGYVNTPFEIK